jgi:hypothetical protein
MSRLIVLVLSAISLIGMGMPQAESAPLPIAGVTASDAQIPNVPENTIDGDLDTRWAAQGDGQWIQYELQECVAEALISIWWYQGANHANRGFWWNRVITYSIDISEDGENWAPVQQWNESDGDILSVPLGRDEFTSKQYYLGRDGATTLNSFNREEPVICYVRIVGYGNRENDWNSINEVQIDSDPDADLDPARSTRPFDVVASDEQLPNVAENTIDNDLSTRWSAQGEGQWIEYDFGETGTMLNEVSIAWYNGGRRSSTFDIEVSTDGTDWTKIYGGYSSGTTPELQPYSFAAISARYWRIVGFGSSRSDWNAITEIEFRYVP